MKYILTEPKYFVNQKVEFTDGRNLLRPAKGLILNLTTTYNDAGMAVHIYLVRKEDERQFWQGYVSERNIYKAL